MKHRVEIDATFGETICDILEKYSGRKVEIILIVYPHCDDGKLGNPTFITSQPPEITEQMIIQVAGSIAMGSKPIVDGVHTKDN